MALLDGREVYAHIYDDLGQLVKAADDKIAATEGVKPGSLLVLDDREIYAYIADDVGKILKDASDKGEGEGFQFKQLQTEYIPGGAPAEDNPYQEGGAAPVAAPAAKRLVQVTLEVSTTRKDATKFVADTIQAWLFANATREGVPYTIESVQWDLPLTHLVPQPGEAATGAEGVQPPRQAQPERPRPSSPTNRTAGDPGARPGHGHAPAPMPGRRPVGGGVVGGQPSAAPTEMTNLAPLPAMPAEGEPGETVSTFTITWDAVIIEDKPAETQS
jgi:hypothetical protein